MQWYAKTVEEVFRELHSREDGLTASEAKQRLDEHGENRLPETPPPSLISIFIRQFESPLIYILGGAAAVVFLMGEWIDGSVILFILLFNAIVGSVQEGRAENALRALRSLVETRASVIRGGVEENISDKCIVPGDVIELTEGDKVPADARVIVSHSLTVDESSFTGESTPVRKSDDVLKAHKKELPASEQVNMLFKGTHVVSGGGRAVVVATGEHTVIGRIATTLSSITSEVPLKKDIRALSHVVIVVTLLISLSLFVAGVVLGKSAIEMFMIAVSLTVSVIPEGLPIVVTLILATGAWRMLRRNALVKRLQAVEALGQAKVIAVDKTGTITKNELTVQRVYVDGRTYEVGGSGYDPAGDIRLEGETVEPLNHADLVYAGKVSAFCASGHASFDSETNRWRVSGDPTEAALSVFAEKVGFRRDELNHESPKVAEVLFNSGTRYHAVVHMVDEKPFLAVAGAPEVILDLSSQVWSEGGPHKLTEAKRRELEKVFTSMTEGGMRVIALAAREDAEHTIEDGSVQDLTFVHFVGMIDALRVEAQEAIEQARAAGIRVVMITGDHVLTAKAIASTAGIYREGDKALTGADIEALSADELREQLAEVTVFARVTPEHKLHIIEGYKARGEVVAMTGDGVNDAPSLVAADLGVAMGAIGTEVAKEASDIVLLDDNMSTIVAAIEEGRNIYRTIKKVILYLFSTSLGEILTITVALAIGYPLPLLAAQIIWLNFVTDGFLTVALAMEPKEDDLLRRSFSKAQRALIDGTMVVRMFTMAIPMAIGSLILFGEYVDEGDITRAMTIALTTLAAFQWFNAWNVRHATHSVFTMNPFSNRYLLGATAIVILLQLAAVYTPFLQHVLRTSPLSLSDWLWIIPVAASIILVEEVRKLIVRILEARRARRKRIIEALPEAAETAPAQ